MFVQVPLLIRFDGELMSQQWSCVLFAISQVDRSRHVAANHHRIRFPTQLKAPNQHWLQTENHQSIQVLKSRRIRLSG
jgi:hypothetical protein